MAITAGTDTYITLAAADTYIATMPGTYAAVWAALATDAIKEKFLKRAARYLDTHYLGRWVGSIMTTTQVMSFPRYGTDNEGRVIDSSYPTNLKYAQCEVAARMANSEELNTDLSRGGEIVREKIGPIETEFENTAPIGTVYQEVEALLKLLLLQRGSTSRLLRV